MAIPEDPRRIRVTDNREVKPRAAPKAVKEKIEDALKRSAWSAAGTTKVENHISIAP
ncbi:MAG TPA: hypothetical protein VMR62_04275 [Bryobacteraceae bacterium]|nr:hypothetical protein [Bryobacteraceae bacterium]